MGVLNTTPATYTDGPVLTAATLNTEVKTPMTTIQSAWTSYTISGTATTTNPTWGGGLNEGSYMQIGKTVYGQMMLTAGASFAAGSGNYRFSLPVTAQTTGISLPVVGGGYVFDSSAAVLYVCTLRLATTTTVQVYYPVAGTTYQVSATSPWVPASGDQFNFFFEYEAA